MSVQEMPDMARLLASAPRESWIALTPDQSRVVGSGRTLEEALEEAGKNGVAEPVVMWSPKVWRPTAYADGGRDR